MILDNQIANFLVKKNFPLHFVKYILRALYVLAAIIIYVFVFSKINNSISGVIIFLIISIFFEIIRSRKLSAYLKSRN